MDHMRISGNEPSSVILSQTKWFQNVKNDCQKVPNQAKAKIIQMELDTFKIIDNVCVGGII